MTKLIAVSGSPYFDAAELSMHTVKKDGACGPFWVNVKENSFNLASSAVKWKKLKAMILPNMSGYNLSTN